MTEHPARQSLDLAHASSAAALGGVGDLRVRLSLLGGFSVSLSGDKSTELVMSAASTARCSPISPCNEPWARMTFGFSLSTASQHERALAESQACLMLNPSFALARMIHGWVLLRAGRFDEALSETSTALRMSPTDSFAGLYTATHGLALLGARRFAEALPFLRASVAAFAEYSRHYTR